MQLQQVGIHVNDKPKFLALNPTDDHNSIVVPSDDGGITLQIPLCIQGVTTYFDSRKLMKQEFEACDLKIDMTANLPDWDRLMTQFEEQENSLLDDYSQLQDHPTR